MVGVGVRGDDLIISSGTTTLCGYNDTFDLIEVQSGATLAVCDYDGSPTNCEGGGVASGCGYVNISCNNFTVASGGIVSGDSAGYRGVSQDDGEGPGGGSYMIYYGGGGGGYGGVGGDGGGAGGSAYGTSNGLDIEMGSAAGGSRGDESGGDGGGLIKIDVQKGEINVFGTIRTNGVNGLCDSGFNEGAGGGAGGGVLLYGKDINLTSSTFSSDGGDANDCPDGGGGGGGGRIKIFYTVLNGNDTVSYSISGGDNSGFGTDNGSPGTLYFESVVFDTGPPTYTLNQTNTTIAGSDIEHSLNWTDDTALNSYIFSWYNGANWTFSNQTADLESGIIQNKGSYATSQNYLSGEKVPSSNTAVTNGWANPTYLYSNDGSDTTETTANDAHSWYNFSTNIPAGATINGIKIITQCHETGFLYGSHGKIGIEVSNNSGTSWSSTGYDTGAMSTTVTNYTKGSYTDLWGLTWSTTSSNNLRVRLTAEVVPFYYAVGCDVQWVDINYTTTGASNTEASKTPVNYTNVYPNNVLDVITNINVTVNVSVYNSTSSNGKNSLPDLFLRAYNGTQWVDVGNMSVSGTGNFTKSISSASILTGWNTISNRNISIQGMYFDANTSTYDEINYTAVWVQIDSTGEFLNDTAVSFGAGTWSNVTKIVNSTVGSTIKWCIYANDTSDNWNGSSCINPFSYVTTSGVAVDATFSVAMPSDYTSWTEISGENEGGATATDWISFNFSDIPENYCEPYQLGDSSLKQDGITKPIFYIDATGNTDVNISFRFSSPLPTGIDVGGNASCSGTCESSQSTLQDISTSYVKLITGLSQTDSYGNVTFYANVSNSASDGETAGYTLYIKGED